MTIVMNIEPPQANDAGEHLSSTGEAVASPLGQVSWALFEFSRSPYLSLVTIYVIAPYFTNTVIGDPIRGQGRRTNTIAGFMVAILAPLTGAMSDRMGRRNAGSSAS